MPNNVARRRAAARDADTVDIITSLQHDKVRHTVEGVIIGYDLAFTHTPAARYLCWMNGGTADSSTVGIELDGETLMIHVEDWIGKETAVAEHVTQWMLDGIELSTAELRHHNVYQPRRQWLDKWRKARARI